MNSVIHVLLSVSRSVVLSESGSSSAPAGPALAVARSRERKRERESSFLLLVVYKAFVTRSDARSP